MPTSNEIYIQQNTKTSHKHWESMGVYALHYALREVEIQSQYQVSPYKVDAYIPAAKIIIEIDEPYHKKNKINDEIRQKFIEEKMEGCQFIRVDVEGNFYEQIDQIIVLIKSMNLPKWIFVPPRVQKSYTGERAIQKNQGLMKAGIYDYLEKLIFKCNEMGLATSELNSSNSGNGFLSFRINFDGIELNLIVGVGKKIKFQLLEFAPEVINKIGIEATNLIQNKYRNIVGYESGCSEEKAFSLLRKIRDTT